MEDTVTVKIEKCRKCGEIATICKIVEPISLRDFYWIQCGSCGKRTPRRLHIEDSILYWNNMNRPEKNKPKYLCSCCDEPISLGFAKCPHCGADIDWG